MSVQVQEKLATQEGNSLEKFLEVLDFLANVLAQVCGPRSCG